MHNMTNMAVLSATFLGVSAAVCLLVQAFAKRNARLDSRIADALGPAERKSADRAKSLSLPRPDRMAALRIPVVAKTLLPNRKEECARLQSRMVRAGIYSTSALSGYYAARLVLTVVFFSLGPLAIQMGLASPLTGMIFGAVAGGMGMLAPSFWLDHRIAKRQSTLRNSLPDFLDLMTACLEGGLSLQGAIQRVSDEFQLAHPVMAGEMGIVLREVELGASIDKALRRFADRSGSDDVRSLATFVQQARKFGAVMSDALRAHSDMLRVQREQRAEELAQKAAVKILLPTLLLIFPAVFVVLAGPAVIQIQEKFAATNRKEARRTDDAAASGLAARADRLGRLEPVIAKARRRPAEARPYSAARQPPMTVLTSTVDKTLSLPRPRQFTALRRLARRWELLGALPARVEQNHHAVRYAGSANG